MPVSSRMRFDGLPSIIDESCKFDIKLISRISRESIWKIWNKPHYFGVVNIKHNEKRDKIKVTIKLLDIFNTTQLKHQFYLFNAHTHTHTTTQQARTGSDFS